MSRFGAYFFDFDGTLGDTAPDIRDAWLSSVKKLNLPLDNFEKYFRVGPPIQETTALLYPDMPLDEQRILQETYKSFYDERANYTAEPYPGIMDMLQKLHEQNRKIYIVTNKRLKPLWKLSAKFDLFKYCSGLFSQDIVDPVNHLKKPELLALALRISGVDKHQAVMIGDTELDIKAGKDNLIPTCAVTWGYGSVDLLNASSPDFMIDSPDAMP
jgi:phosphoglycolate phosphatase